MTISIDAENAFDKIHHAFMKKVLENGWLEGTHLNSMKAIGEKPTANIIIDGRKCEAISNCVSLSKYDISGQAPCLGVVDQHKMGSIPCVLSGLLFYVLLFVRF